MDISQTLAARSYQDARSAAQATPGSGAGDAFRDAASGFVDTLNNAEQTATAALGGDADPTTLVQALAASEIAVETAVTLRDKVVEAYQEILRMPV